MWGRLQDTLVDPADHLEKRHSKPTNATVGRFKALYMRCGRGTPRVPFVGVCNHGLNLQHPVIIVLLPKAIAYMAINGHQRQEQAVKHMW
jgi:hypothetical protein